MIQTLWRLAFLGCVTLLAALSIAAKAVEIQVRDAGPVLTGGTSVGAEETRVVVTVQRVDVSSETHSRRLEISIGVPVEADMQTGVWQVSASADGFYIEPRVIHVAEGGSGPVILDAWPTGSVKGRLAELPAEAAEEQVLVRTSFSPLPGSVGTLPLPAMIECAVEDDRSFSCAIPAGVWALRIDPGPFAPHFLRKIHVEAGGATEAGIVPLVPGLSLSGTVVIPSRTKSSVEGIELSLVSAGGGEAVDWKKSRTDDAGFFQFTGLLPGLYDLTARAPRLTSRVVAVEMRAGSHAALKEPLELLPPMTLDIEVLPPASPSGDPWVVEIVSSGPGRAEIVARAVIDPDKGAHRVESLPRAEYRVELEDSFGAAWATERIIPDDVVHVQFAPRPVEVRGRLRVGDRPVAAEIRIQPLSGVAGARHGAPLEADEDGNFSGSVPPPADDKWAIRVENRDLGIIREITRSVVVEEGAVWLDLELPASALTGEVLDQAGRPAPRAYVNIGAVLDVTDSDSSDRPEFVQTLTDAAGEFLFLGLAGGRYQIEADGGPLGRAPRQTIEIGEDTQEKRVTLHLEPEGILEGRVLRGSVGVAGVNVEAWAVDEIGQGIISGRTDAEGRFRLDSFAVQGQIIQVGIRAPGAGFKMFQTSLPPGPIEIPLDASPGTIVIRKSPPTSGFGTLLMHRGAAVWPGTLIPSGHAYLDHERGVTVALVEPGDYSVCTFSDEVFLTHPWGALVPDDSCAHGYLPPGGTLDLSTVADRIGDDRE